MKRPPLDFFLAAYFVAVWGAGYVAVRAGLEDAEPFAFLALRFGLAAALMGLIVLATRASLPRGAAQTGHVLAAGLLMHAANLGGSHYAQYLGMPAGITALTLALQPLATALFVTTLASPALRERLSAAQWLGVVMGLAGVTLVVWHKLGLGEFGAPALAAIVIALMAITAGTLYQQRWCAGVDLRGAALVQLAASAVVMALASLLFERRPVAWTAQLGASLAFLVILNSILAFNILHWLVRRGGATRVTSLIYLTPLVAAGCEYLLYGTVPPALTWIGMAVACAGVALVTLRRRAAGQPAPAPMTET